MGDVIEFPKAKVSPQPAADFATEQFAAACASAAAQALLDLAADPTSLTRSNEMLPRFFED